jgi:hypothetical protein
LFGTASRPDASSPSDELSLLLPLIDLRQSRSLHEVRLQLQIRIFPKTLLIP